jgi:hypothetical protein
MVDLNSIERCDLSSACASLAVRLSQCMVHCNGLVPGRDFSIALSGLRDLRTSILHCERMEHTSDIMQQGTIRQF